MMRMIVGPLIRLVLGRADCTEKMSERMWGAIGKCKFDLYHD